MTEIMKRGYGMGERATILIASIAMIILLPYIMTVSINGKYYEENQISQCDSGMDVLMKENGANRLLDVEEYIVGVLPGLISADSEIEVIEAQAVAVRTKIYYSMGTETVVDATTLPYTYYSVDQRLDRWGKKNFRTINSKFEQAVLNTAKKIE